MKTLLTIDSKFICSKSFGRMFFKSPGIYFVAFHYVVTNKNFKCKKEDIIYKHNIKMFFTIFTEKVWDVHLKRK